MYPGNHAKHRADQPAFIMAQSGEAVSYAELEARTNRLAHFLRDRGLQRLDHYSIFMENNARYIECCGAGERAGLYYTCINSYLTADELAYIVNNSESRVLIFSQAKRAVALEALRQCPKIEVSLGTADASGHDIAVNATSLGLEPGDPLSFDLMTVSPEALVAEVIMIPKMTPLLRAAEARGHPIHYGTLMLDGQLGEMMEFFGLGVTNRNSAAVA